MAMLISSEVYASFISFFLSVSIPLGGLLICLAQRRALIGFIIERTEPTAWFRSIKSYPTLSHCKISRSEYNSFP